MALTGNFSLRYPTDLSLVDIAQDMQNLAEDVDTQLILKTRGPASSTDNTIPRFDGTTGKVLQSSYIAISDSGYFITDLTIKKNTPMLTLYSDYSYARLTLRSDGGNAADILLRGGYLGAYDRWVVGKTDEVEGSGNAGSNFAITAYDNTGLLLSTPLKITRSTGKVNLGSVGATAGLELGASGPRLMSGTGSPEGVVSAPIGSIWYQTNGTMTGGTHWRKAKNATSSKGWVALGGVGNLLTTNEATFESGTINQSTTDGDYIYAQHGSLSVSNAEAYQGTYSLALAVTSTVPGLRFYANAANTVGAMPVTAGRTYTFSFWAKSNDSTASPQAGLRWYTNDGTTLISTLATVAIQLSSTWKRYILVGTAPATAALAGLHVSGFGSGEVGKTIYFDNIGFWEGTGGTWQPPGTPISDLGVIVASGSPEGIIPAPVGSIYYDTAETNGAKRWRKNTGTGTTGWVVIDGDTGWRDVSADILNGWTGNIYIRRINNEVHVRFDTMNKASATNDQILSVSPYSSGVWNADVSSGYSGSALDTTNITGVATWLASTYSVNVRRASIGTGNNARGNMTWLTTNAWPTTLPGS